ncbi:DUF4126 domain-containing protein [Halonatronum saccharophilum]|uniref:DUF4126 domain-containing protein n=1 Tax=Halonatronum saccharophilum TaxID=150060 RepID=UPI0004B53664|nr:DUF4126 domain-containing protein [Halonatronum saccharophilum]
MNILLNIIIGLGLSAACGFKVFTPLLIMSIASLSGDLELLEEFKWIGSYGALITLSVATFIEVFSYYFPLIDRLLIKIEGPTAVIAGSIMMASCVVELSPLLQWAVAIIAGGGTSAIVEFLSLNKLKVVGYELRKEYRFYLSSLTFLAALFFSLLALYAPYLSFLLSLVLIFKAFKYYIESHISIKVV